MESIARTPGQLGNILRQRRRELKLTQRALAAKLRVHQPAISQLETSARVVRTSTLFSLIAALNLELVLRPRTKASEKDIEALF